eukprot:SAG11_NODE_73_length_18072_cov_8.670005_19_plen_68_part_00
MALVPSLAVLAVALSDAPTLRPLEAVGGQAGALVLPHLHYHLGTPSDLGPNLQFRPLNFTVGMCEIY